MIRMLCAACAFCLLQSLASGTFISMIGDIRRLIAAQPFVPFTIHTASGAQVRVPTVDHIAVSPTGARVIVFDDDDSTILISALLISHIIADSAPVQSRAA